jgi:hypothetical protein
MASAAEITRIVRRRLGKRIRPSPAERELITSPYNLPTPGLREERMLADFAKVAPEIGFTDVKDVSRPQSTKRGLISTCKLDGKEWHFVVIAIGGHFGIAEFKAVTGYDLLNERGITVPLKPVPTPLSKHAFFPLVLVMGRIGSLKSQLRYFGYAQMPLSFGAYIGPGLKHEGSRTSNVEGINIRWHRFLLAGIIDLETLQLRLEQFLSWLKQETCH